MNHKLPLILAIGMALLGLLAFIVSHEDQPVPGRIIWPGTEDAPTNLQQTYTPPVNIYLPEMMFLVVKDTDDLTATRCKNMTYRTVDSFSRRVNSNLVRADKKLYTLARIIYSECIDITIATFKDGL